MKIIIDTDVAVSGLLWGGPPNQILSWARDGAVRIPACLAYDFFMLYIYFRKTLK